MKQLLAIILLQLLALCLNEMLVDALDVQSIANDLTEFNISCTNDNCQSNEEDSLINRACHCGMICAQLGSCCLDSPYANIPQPKQKPECRYLHGAVGYFIIHECPFVDSVWANLCNDESIEDDDIQKLVPVTSLKTFITYKNYYCFKCHETTYEFLYWNIKIRSIYPLVSPKKTDGRISLIYNRDTDKMMAYYDDEIDYIYVDTSLQVPSKIINVVHACDPDVISECSDEWPDDEIRNKCESYMALKSIDENGESVIMYKNIHCALCNYENLTDLHCKKKYSVDSTYGNRYDGFDYVYGGRNGGEVYHFTFTYLLDVNPSDGELVGKVKKCSNDHVWDPYTNKCRRLTCALPGFQIKNGKCIEG